MSPGESTHQGESELSDFLKRIQAGDEGAARELLGRFEAEVRLVVRRQLPRLLRSRFDSLDFLQSVWGSFFRRMRTAPTEFEDSRHLVAFLARAAKNKVIDEYRRAASRKHDMHREEPLWAEGRRPKDVPDPIDSPSEVAQAHEVFVRLRELMPVERRTILELKAEGLSSKDIGERLGHQRADGPARSRGPEAANGDGVGGPVMSVSSAGRRTWEEASSPTAVRLAREYEQAWRDSDHLRDRPDPQDFLEAAGTVADGQGTRLALLRADLTLRWESGQKIGAQWYLDRYKDLGEDTIVALIYEEFCLREEDEEEPEADEFLARYAAVSGPLRRVLDIHQLVGSGSSGTPLFADAGTATGSVVEFPEAGQTIAGFHLVEELGRGAFARVFLARERQLADRLVALKVTRRGSREPQTLARLQHTHIVPVYSHQVDPVTGLNLLCMPFFGRTTLAQVLADGLIHEDRSGAALIEALDRLEPGEGVPAAGPSAGRAALIHRSYEQAIAWWGARLAEALDHAHDRGVLHRDIKPSNVLVTSDGMPMLLDFNLAREPVAEGGSSAGAATLGGTVDYMAPEHLRALADGGPEEVDARADIYSLGVVLYEALTGERPFPSPRHNSSVFEALHRAAKDRERGAPGPRAIVWEIPRVARRGRPALPGAPARQALSIRHRTRRRPQCRLQGLPPPPLARALAQPRRRLDPPSTTPARHDRRRIRGPLPDPRRDPRLPAREGRQHPTPQERAE